MGLNPFEKIKSFVDGNLKKITPESREDNEPDRRDPIYHEEPEGEKFFEKGPDDFQESVRRKEELTKVREKIEKTGKE